jgi:putative oxidoreductase
LQAFGPAVLRLAAGVVFAAHGAQKLFGLFGGGGPSGTAAWFDALGLSPAYLLAIVVGLVEFAGGLLLMAGAFTLVVSALLSFVMLVAIWKVHLENGFFLNWTIAPGQGHGYEFNLMLVAALVALMFTGAGALSVDERRLRSAESLAAGRARLRSGGV